MGDSTLQDIEPHVEAVSRASAHADGAEPLDESAWRRLRHHLDELDVRLADESGFTIVDGEVLHLVVHPAHRARGLGGRLLDDALRDHPAVRLAWSHGDHPAAARLARRAGFGRVRELWVMRRSLDGAEHLRDAGSHPSASLEIRSFRQGDEAELLRVNAAAFAHHPEQGSMDAMELAERMAEPWFDPADLIVAAGGGRMHGFHWTKRHSEVTGEVYVLAIDPAAQGSGLGKVLVEVGLRHLASHGLRAVMLYVESDNLPAVRLYEKLGFTHPASDTHVMYERAVREVGEVSARGR